MPRPSPPVVLRCGTGWSPVSPQRASTAPPILCRRSAGTPACRSGAMAAPFAGRRRSPGTPSRPTRRCAPKAGAPPCGIPSAIPRGPAGERRPSAKLFLQNGNHHAISAALRRGTCKHGPETWEKGPARGAPRFAQGFPVLNGLGPVRRAWAPQALAGRPGVGKRSGRRPVFLSRWMGPWVPRGHGRGDGRGAAAVGGRAAPPVRTDRASAGEPASTVEPAPVAGRGQQDPPRRAEAPAGDAARRAVVPGSVSRPDGSTERREHGAGIRRGATAHNIQGG